MIEDKFKIIENLFADLLKEEANKINKDFKDLICISYIYPPNDEQEFKNCTLGLDVVLHKADLDKADNLFLEIYIEERENALGINARVVWGSPLGKIQSIFKYPVPVTEENLVVVKEKLPYLISKLRETIRDNPNGI